LFIQKIRSLSHCIFNVVSLPSGSLSFSLLPYLLFPFFFFSLFSTSNQTHHTFPSGSNLPRLNIRPDSGGGFASVFDGWVWCSLGRLGLHLAGVLGWSNPDAPHLKIRPDLSLIAVEHITAVEWLVLDNI